MSLGDGAALEDGGAPGAPRGGNVLRGQCRAKRPLLRDGAQANFQATRPVALVGRSPQLGTKPGGEPQRRAEVVSVVNCGNSRLQPRLHLLGMIWARLLPCQADKAMASGVNGGWYNCEINKYPRSNYGKPNPDTSAFHDWGHFSQMVWKGCKQVGRCTQYCFWPREYSLALSV
ncbi:hypothetical protein V8F33_010125 [Rhypophila sp. PSN 637]